MQLSFDRRLASGFLRRSSRPVYPDMKNIFIISLLISFAMICSCQKQDSTLEQQLAQRKVELDARETELDERQTELNEREVRLDGREKALAEREKAAANARAVRPDVESRSVTRDPAQLEAEKDRTMQQLPAELRALVPDRSQMNAAKAEKDRQTQEQRAQRQAGLEASQSRRQRKLEISGRAGFSAVETSSPTSSHTVEDTLSSPSPTPQ
jgi:hypothetical protein